MTDKEIVKIGYLDGSRFYHAFQAGGNSLVDNLTHLNKINVFPVPDGDTGTNLAATVRSIMEIGYQNHSLKETLSLMADQALSGAHGNSGIIFAQYIHGLSRELKEQHRVNVEHFSEVAHKAVQYIYDSLVNPVEGTMLTVIKDWAQSLMTHSKKTTDFSQLLSSSLKDAKDSLKETPKKLKVLADNGVVDAGAEGFVNFLEGVTAFIQNGKLKESVSNVRPKTVSPIIGSHDLNPEQGRYCSEAILTNSTLSVKELKNRFANKGESFIVAGDSQKMHLHIHTDQPDVFFTELQEVAEIKSIKVDDMCRQHEVIHNKKFPVGILTDTACDLPPELIDRYQIQEISFGINAGNRIFLDKKTIHADQFYRMLQNEYDHPRSSQPSPKRISDVLSFMNSHYENVIFATISSSLSGVYNTSRSVIKQHGFENTGLIDTKHITATQGLIVLRIARAIESGMPFGEIMEKADEWIKKTKILVDVKTLKYMIRGGRVSPLKGYLATLLNMKPMITLDEDGKASAHGKSFSRKANMKKLLKYAEEHSSEIDEYAIVHAADPKRAEMYAVKLHAVTGKKPLYVMPLAPVVGVHNGVGAIAVAFSMK